MLIPLYYSGVCCDYITSALDCVAWVRCTVCNAPILTRARVTALTMPVSDHLTLSQSQQWPSLCVVWITATTGTSVSASLQHVRRDLGILADMVSHHNNGIRLIVIMPTTKHLGSHGLAPCQIHFQAMSQNAKHSEEARLVIAALLDKGDYTLRQLSGMIWPNLLILSIASNHIGSDAFLDLKPRNLPSLRTCTIKADNFDTQAALHLAKGLPRMLSSLMLYTSIDAAAAHHLSTAEWPNLVVLRINSNTYKLPSSQSLDAECGHKLAQGRWPLHEELDLGCNDLDQCAIGHLIQGRWPMLRMLTLDSKCMIKAVCDMLCVVNVSEQLQAMQCAMPNRWPGFTDAFQLKRLSSHFY